MRAPLSLVIFLLAQLCMANMASPIWKGTFSSSAFCSRDIDILKEKIHITIDKDFKTAAFVIEYYVRNDLVEGFQIPLLFHAKDYLGDFKVWVDNQDAFVGDVPSEYKTNPSAPFEKFSDSFSSLNDAEETVTIYWEKGAGSIYNINELKYFDFDLSRGESIIRVEYTASVWTDISKWVTEYSFRYSLSPAKHWKSFGSLEIIVDGSAFASPLTSSLGQPPSGSLNSVAVWNFSTLPADFFEITFVPTISAIAKILITLGPISLTIILALLFALLHYWGINKFRKSKPANKYSWVVITGSLIIPLLILIGFVLLFELIDMAIGSVAGRYHGYIFLVIIFYPVLLPVYWIIMWLIDRRIKSKRYDEMHKMRK